MTSQQKQYTSLLFTPRAFDKPPDGQRSRSPHSTRSPSISAYGRSLAREGSASRRRSLTPTGSRETPPPPPPALSLLDSSRDTLSTTGTFNQQGNETLPFQPQESTSYSQSNDTWITVYGFNPEDQAAVLREFSKCGDVLYFGSGREDRVNWLHLRYANGFQVQRALLKNGQVVNGRLMVGVKRLEDRYRAVVESISSSSSNVGLKSSVKPVTIRPYRLEKASGQAVLPVERMSLWSKVNEYVFGL